MSGIDDLNFEDLVDGAINTMDDAKTERIASKQILKPRKLKRNQIAEDTVETDVLQKQSSPPPTRGTSSTSHSEGRDPRASFEHIYARAGVEATDFTVFRLEELFNDDDLKALDDTGRAAVVRAILKSHDVSFDVVVDDAVARQSALDSHDQRLKSNIDRVEDEMEKENARLQSEIEEYANPRINRMERNNERVQRLRSDYDEWVERKRVEQDRIVEILSPWGGDVRLEADTTRDTERTDAVSGAEAFEPEPEPKVVVQVQGSQPIVRDSWAHDESSSVDEDDDLHDAALSDAVDDSGDFDFAPRRVRVPRTPLQWLVTLVAVALWFSAGLLVTAQLISVVAPGALVIAFVVPPLLAVLLGLLVRKESFWSGPVVIWAVLSILMIAGAHATPQTLVGSLTKRPIWFVQEIGLPDPAPVEEAVASLTVPYAESVAPLLGVESSLWKAPTQPEAVAK